MKVGEADAKKTDAMTKTRVETHKNDERRRFEAYRRYNLADTIPTVTTPHPAIATS